MSGDGIVTVVFIACVDTRTVDLIPKHEQIVRQLFLCPGFD